MNDANKIFCVYTESKQEPQMRVDEHGTKRWMVNGKYHREDGAAIEWNDGSKAWYQNGKLHRDGGAAIERVNGANEWYQNGKLHREDGAAIEYASGAKQWFLNNKQYGDVVAWAKTLLKNKNIKPTQDAIDDKVAEMMQADLFN